MKLRLELRPYRVALERRFSNSRREWRERAGLLLELTDEEGVVGQGEAAPLPGFSREDLSSVERALSAYASATLESPAFTREAIGAFTGSLGHHESARFGLETALLDWFARRRAEPVHRLLRELSRTTPGVPSIPLAALLDASTTDETLEAAARALAHGFRTLKLKLGRPGAFEGELRTLEKVRALVGPNVKLRLDANRAFPRGVALERLAALAPFRPELVEEPLEPGAPLPPHPGVPLALDESLAENRELSRELSGECGVVAAVLKPAMHGGALSALALAARAMELGITPIVSHAFEGPIGFALACELALALGASSFAAGLAPHAALAPWHAPLPAAVDGASLVLHSEPGLGLPRLRPPA